MSPAEKPKKHSGKRRLLTADAIVTRALKIADEEGFDTLSMRKLAGSLGVTAMSLYNHVAGKDDLLDLMLTHVVAEIESPTIGGAWDVMIRRRAHSMREALLRHRWASTHLVSKITMGAPVLRDIDATLGCLVTAGFTYAQADWARNAIDAHVYGYTMQELNIPVQPDEYRATAARYLPQISKADYPFMYGAAVVIADGTYDGVNEFGFGLELILDGLKRWVGEK